MDMSIWPLLKFFRYFTVCDAWVYLLSTDILSVSPTFGSNQGGTKISIAVNAGPLTDYPREDIKVYVGGKGI